MIAIKNTEMSSTCYKCDFCHYDNSEGMDVCDITGNYISEIDGKNKRADNCPLVEIITCKDCEHRMKAMCMENRHFVDDNFYCKDGERRE